MLTRESFHAAFVGFVILGAFLLAGCSGSANIAGTYELDKEALKASAQAEADAKKNSDDPSDAMAASMMVSMIDHMNIVMTLGADGTATIVTQMIGDPDTATGTWKLDGKTITVTAGVPGKDIATMNGTISGDTITMHPEKEHNMPANMVFKKKS